MRILILGWEYPPFNSGGLGVACHWLIKYLSQKHQIIFVLPKKLNISFPYGQLIFAQDYIEENFSDVLTIPYETSPRSLSWRQGSLYEQSLLYREAVKKICEKFNFDLIHAHDWLTYPAGIAAKNITGKPLIIHVHATEYDRGGGNSVNPIVYQIEKDGLLNADKIIAVSNYTKNKLLTYYGAHQEKIAVIHNGIEIDGNIKINNDFKKIFGKKIVIFVGRFTLQKGPDYFLKAAKKTLDYYKDVVFIMSGSGDMEHYLIEETARLKIADKVIFSGFLRDDQLNKLYQNADLFVMPSVSEPFGITALEAIANGAPVLISKQSGVQEVLKHALKVDFWDVDEMVNKILAVLRHKPLSKVLTKNASQEIKNISWEKAAQKVNEIYWQLAPAFG